MSDFDSTTELNFPVSQPMFDYADLDTDTRVYVQERADEIRARGRRMTEDIIAIGGKLIEVKDRLGHGQFGAWLEREFQWDARMAQNFMRVYSRFKSEIISDLNVGPTILYMLAAPSVSYEVAEDVLNRARAGEHVTVAEVREAINAARPEPEPGMFDDGKPVLVDDYETGRPIWVNEDGEVIGVDPYDAPAADAPALTEESLEEVITQPANWMSASNEWYTPAEYVNAASELMGAIDLDPASNPLANETVGAGSFYTEADDGLSQVWSGRVWLNPPYGTTGGESNAGVWARKLISEYRAGHITEAVLLVNATTERKWFAQLWNFPICFTNHRIEFYTPEGVGQQPISGNAIIYLGDNLAGFVDIFSQFGDVAGSFTRGVAHV